MDKGDNLKLKFLAMFLFDSEVLNFYDSRS